MIGRAIYCKIFNKHGYDLKQYFVSKYMNMVFLQQTAGVLLTEWSVQTVDQEETSAFYTIESKRYIELNSDQSQQLPD